MNPASNSTGAFGDRFQLDGRERATEWSVRVRMSFSIDPWNQQGGGTLGSVSSRILDASRTRKT